MQVVALIREGSVIDKILAHIGDKFEVLPLPSRPPPDSPPEWDFFPGN